MALPSFKNVHIASEKKETIFSQLKKINWDESPIVLNVLHLLEFQLEALENIDLFFEANPNNKLPYQVYAFGKCPLYTGPLYLAREVKELPRFYNQKTRPLNAKENGVMNKVLLKRTNLVNLRSSEYIPVLNQYAHAHKKISLLNKELDFINEVQIGLRKYYGKEEE